MIRTERLLLRPWRESDLEPFARMNADPRCMECYPSIMSKEESDLYVRKLMAAFEKQGWGQWAISIPDQADFIGYVGLVHVRSTDPFAPAVEIGWRLAYDYWGKGYATEAAQAALAYGFQTLGLQEIISFTAVPNIRSRRVMEKLGMHHDPKDDFDHPRMPEGHWLRPHVLYRLARSAWLANRQTD